MAYADYDFYRSVYKGNMTAADFERLSERASDIIDSKTGLIIPARGFENIPDGLALRIKKACCAVAEAVYINEKGGAKASESVGDYSVTYASGALSDEQRIDNALTTYIPDLIKLVRWL